jgi:hypothetical protein
MGKNTALEAGRISLGTNHVSMCWVEKLYSQFYLKKKAPVSEQYCHDS